MKTIESMAGFAFIAVLIWVASIVPSLINFIALILDHSR